MSYLIDTQILIWSLGEFHRLPAKILKALANIENEIFVSSVSIWEIAIKISIGKLTFPFELKNILQEIYELNFNVLDICTEHLIKVAELPFYHKDPFDRLLISQAIIENIPVISTDKIFTKYDIEVYK